MGQPARDATGSIAQMTQPDVAANTSNNARRTAPANVSNNARPAAAAAAANTNQNAANKNDQTDSKRKEQTESIINAANREQVTSCSYRI